MEGEWRDRQERGMRAAVPEHLASRRGAPWSLSLIVMKSFKPSGLNEPAKRHSTQLFCQGLAFPCHIEGDRGGEGENFVYNLSMYDSFFFC